MDVFFNCPACGQHLVIDEAGVGLTIPCPKCAKDLTVPARKPAETPENEKERTVALKWTPPTSTSHLPPKK
jgi:hypothetical protein